MIIFFPFYMLYPFFLAICCHLTFKFIFVIDDHNGNKSFDFLCNPRFIVYMYLIMMCIHCILLYMLMVDPIKSNQIKS